MTITDDASVEMTTTENGTESNENETEKKKRARDFTKVRSYHEELAAFVNERSGLDPVTPNQVKALLTLKTDYGNTPEAQAAREQRKAEREAEKTKYAGMTEDQIKAAKALDRAEKQAEKLRTRAEETVARARELANQATGSGEDLQAVVESNQNGVESPDPLTTTPEESEAPQRRGLRRNR